MRLLKIIQSVLAAAFGVQSGNKYKEDFEATGPLPYIIVGLILTAGFILLLYTAVQFALNSI